MALKGNQSTARALNRRLVLDQLRQNGAMSRSAIANAVDLSQAAISFVTSDLIEEGLVIEGKTGPGSVRRRPVPLEINYGSRVSVGLKVKVDCVEGAITDLATRVLAEIRVPLTDHQPESVVKASAKTTTQLISKAGVDRTNLIGVGMALSGHLDAESGICRNVPRFGWREVPIASMLAEAVSAPVWIDNDANAFAVSQHLFGHARGMGDVVGVALGRGVGAGLVIDGHVHRGKGGAAGEFGHNFEERGRDCECGRNGCLETYCSDPALLQSWRELDPTGYGETPESLKESADAGDSIAREILRDSGIRLGRQVSAIINLLDPDTVVFGGEGVIYGEHVFEPLRQVLAEVCHAGAPLVAIDLPETSWPRGAAALAIQHFFNFEATGGFTPSHQNNEATSFAFV